MIQPLLGNGALQRSGGNNNEVRRYTNAGDEGPADLVTNSQISKMSLADLKQMVSADFAGGNEEESYNANLASAELARRSSLQKG